MEPADDDDPPMTTDRRVSREQREQQLAERGAVGRLAGRMGAVPSSTKAWMRGTLAERRLGTRLDNELAACAVVLHEREPAGCGAIDHLVVAATGIWVIDAVHDHGSVERRRSGVAGEEGVHLTIDGTDRGDLVAAALDRVAAVRAAIEPIGFDWVDLHPVLCFTNADKGLLARPFEIDGVWVTWAKALVDRIAGPGAVDPEAMAVLAGELGHRLPAVAAEG